MHRLRSCALAVLSVCALRAQTTKPDPQIQKIVGQISADRIQDILRNLTSFETRGNFTDPDQENRGIGAARRWIYDQFRSYSPRLEVSYDPWQVRKQGTRILRDVEVVNVVAVLPGTTQSAKRLIVSAHYDSLNIVRKAGAPEVMPDGSEPGADDVIDFDKSADAPAPGATDDASGIAVVMELARVLSQYRFEKTIVFIAFAGEELGLVGSSLYADRAKEHGDQIEAVLNNDIVGSASAGNGRAETGFVHVFSEDPDDSGSRELARYIRACGRLYVPSFGAELVFRNDRFSRGGDHTPFNQDGFTAVRFTSAAEELGIQHTANDTLSKASAALTANVARLNGAAVADLAFAPSPPEAMRVLTRGANKGRLSPNLARGKSRYDAVIRWKDPSPAADLAGYAVVLRSTLAPYWEREIFVGKVTEYTMPDVSIDDVVLGVRAVDTDGHESLVAPYLSVTYPRKPIELAH